MDPESTGGRQQCLKALLCLGREVLRPAPASWCVAGRLSGPICQSPQRHGQTACGCQRMQHSLYFAALTMTVYTLHVQILI